MISQWFLVDIWQFLPNLQRCTSREVHHSYVYQPKVSKYFLITCMYRLYWYCCDILHSDGVAFIQSKVSKHFWTTTYTGIILYSVQGRLMNWKMNVPSWDDFDCHTSVEFFKKQYYLLTQMWADHHYYSFGHQCWWLQNDAVDVWEIYVCP